MGMVTTSPEEVRPRNGFGGGGGSGLRGALESRNATKESITSPAPTLAPTQRPPSSLSAYSNGTTATARKSASVSVGALDPAAKEARASALMTARFTGGNGELLSCFSFSHLAFCLVFILCW